MLQAVDHHLCGCSVVLKAKARKLPATIEALWELSEFTTEQIDKGWQRALGGAIDVTRRRPLSTMAQVNAEIRRLDAVARAFGRSDGLEKLIKEQNRLAYALGAIYIQQRDAQIRKTGKMPPEPPEGFRIDEEPREVQKAGKSPAERITVGFDFELADERALAGLDNQALIWFRDIDGLGYSSASARAAILETAQRQIATGASGYEVAQSLADSAESLYGVGQFSGRGLTYWGGVSENAATIAAVRGELNQLSAMGWTRYEIVNPMDERTTPICSALNGKTVLVPDAVSAMEALDTATTIDEVKERKPWPPGGSAAPVTAATGALPAGAHNLSASESKALSEAGFATPPYHFRCRSYIDIAWEGDPGSVPQMITEPGVVPPVAPAAPPVVPPPAPAGPAPIAPEAPPAPAPGEFPFNIEECRMSSMNLGGNNPKFVIEAPDGSLWMFKDYGQLGASYRTNVDELAAMASRAAGVPHPETYGLRIPKNWKGWDTPEPPAYLRGRGPHRTDGAVSRLYSADEVASFDIGGGVGGLNIETLGAEAVLDVQTDHAINWLISNGDAHFENFIRLADGRVAGIDKAQGFKFFGRDRLAIDYISPQAPMPSTNGFAYAESQLVRYSRGQAGRDFTFTPVLDEAGELTEFGRRLRAVESIPDAEYAATIRPYVEAMHSQGRGMFGYGSPLSGGSVDDALEAIVARKNSLVSDFDNLYRDLETQRRRALGITERTGAPLTAEGRLLQERNLFGSEAPGEIFETVAREKMVGFRVFTGGTAIEDASLQAIRYRVRGETGSRAFQFQLQGRLRPAASRRFESIAEDLRAGRPPGSPSGIATTKSRAELVREAEVRIANMWTGDPTSSGPERDGIFRFIKSFNARMDPGGELYDGGRYILSQSLDRYDEVYRGIMTRLDDVASLTTAKKRREAVARLGYEATAAEVRVARQYRDMMARYKRPDGSWNVDLVESRVGRTNQIDTPKITLGRQPKPRVQAPESDLIPIVEQVEDAMPIEQLAQVGTRGADDAILLESSWNSQATKSWIDDLGYNGRQANRELPTRTYLVRHPTNPNVQIRFTPHSASRRQSQGEFRIVFNKSTPLRRDVDDAREMVERFGIPLSQEGATLEEMKVLWARKQARAAGLDLDSSTKGLFQIAEDLPHDEQLERLAEAFNTAATRTGNQSLRWSSMTDDMTDADFLPVFRDTSDGVGGFPQWRRRDLTTEGFEQAGVHGARSEITGSGAEGVWESMASSGVQGMNATAHRARTGTNWWSGMSPIEDMNTGGANYVFTRINTRFDSGAVRDRIRAGRFNPATDRVPTQAGVYYNRRSLLYSDNIYYRTDKYGEVSSEQFIDRWMVKTMDSTPHQTIRREMSLHSNNEIIMKRGVGFEDVDFWVLDDFQTRERFLEIARSNGVTQVGGRPVEEFFVVGGG